MAKPVIIIRNAAPQDFGGGERFPVFLAEALANQGCDSIIISRSKKLLGFASDQKIDAIKGWWWGKQQWNGVHNLLLPLYAGWQIILTLYYIILFVRIQPSAVHIQSKDDFIAATIAANLLHIKAIWTDHADLKHIWKNISKPLKNPIGKVIYRLAKNTGAITLVSQSEKDLITKELPSNTTITDKLIIIYNGVIDTSSSYKRTLHKPLSYLVASRLVTDKGIGEAIEAFKTIHDSNKNTRLVLIGDGPEKRRFKKAAADYPAITFLGHQPDPLAYMAKADVFLQPTYHEGFSVALVEASMMSLPIIATNVGGNKEIIQNNKTGLLIPPQNSNALAEAMLQLHDDPSLREALATGARKQYVKKFQFDHIVKKSFLPLYKESS